MKGPVQVRLATKRIRAIRAIGLLIAATVFMLASFATAGVAQAATTTCAQQATIVAGDYRIQTNEWNSGLQQCITTSGTAWSVTTANFNMAANGAPATYPSIYEGCHWGNCTSNSGLPLQVGKLTSATTSWSTTQVSSGAYDVAYDLWFNSTPTTSGQPDGTEVMIWLNSRGGVQPFGSETASVSIAGLDWNVWTGQQSTWKIISYVLNPGGTSFRNLNVLALIQDAVSRGSVNSAHYLIDAEAGFEIWQGGQGLSTDSFSFSATGGSAMPMATQAASGMPTVRHMAWWPTSTAMATAAGSGAAGCSASIVESEWNNGFVATVTVDNTGTTPTTTWKVTWIWPENQSILNSWDAAATQSGTSATALNTAYNNAVAAGGSTTFGLQASFTGTNSAPTLSCSATSAARSPW
jgi:Glycosyl hydrolase family 12/Cellulose binding domain